jgi:hypothetical protein
MVATTARVGVDIVGTDKTRAAFSSAQRGLASFNRSLNQMKGVMAGFAGGNLLAGFTRSMVNINKEVPAVKRAIDQLHASWTVFGQKVGEAGLNQALVNFAERIGGLVSGSDSLTRSIGAFMAGAVNTMAAVFEGVGRSIAFVYDNMALFGRLLANIGLVLFARHVLILAGNFVLFARAIGTTGKALAAFQIVQKMGMAGFIVLAGVLGYATGTLDEMRGAIDAVWVKVKDVFPEIGKVAGSVMRDLGVDTTAWTADIKMQSLALDGLGAVTAPAADKLSKFSKAAKDATTNLSPLWEQGQGFEALGGSMKSFNDSLEQVGQTFASNFSQAFSSIVDGSKSAKDAFSDMAKSILSQATSMFLNQAFSGLFGGSGGFGSIFGALFGGFRAAGGPVSGGTPYMVGEKGPELFVPGRSGSIVPNAALGSSRGGDQMTFNINLAGANGNAEVARIAEEAVRRGLYEYQRAKPQTDLEFGLRMA